MRSRYKKKERKNEAFLFFKLPVFDASGKPGSGIYGGNTLWYGSYSECRKYLTLATVGQHFPQVYRWL